MHLRLLLIYCSIVCLTACDKTIANPKKLHGTWQVISGKTTRYYETENNAGVYIDSSHSEYNSQGADKSYIFQFDKKQDSYTYIETVKLDIEPYEFIRDYYTVSPNGDFILAGELIVSSDLSYDVIKELGNYSFANGDSKSKNDLILMQQNKYEKHRYSYLTFKDANGMDIEIKDKFFLTQSSTWVPIYKIDTVISNSLIYENDMAKTWNVLEFSKSQMKVTYTDDETFTGTDYNNTQIFYHKDFKNYTWNLEKL